MKKEEAEKIKELIQRMDFDLVRPEVFAMVDAMVDPKPEPVRLAQITKD